MYEFINGTVSHIFPTYICIENQGIAYRIFTPNPFQWQDQLNATVKCFVEFVVREDSHSLYGFKTREERELFLTLIKVSGIGPKSALSILASGDHQDLVQAIDNGDAQYLTKYPGVGKKTAQQMILDLSGKLTNSQSSSSHPKSQTSDIYQEVYDALVGLGYSTREIQKIKKDLEKQQITSTQQGLSIAFKLLLKK